MGYFGSVRDSLKDVAGTTFASAMSIEFAVSSPTDSRIASMNTLQISLYLPSFSRGTRTRGCSGPNPGLVIAAPQPDVLCDDGHT